ncbi:MAG: septum site-determining protein MinC [Chloroflexi bacterium]|nr:septum site-determining protein MinC [Chloroflexota bacterium]
MTPISFKGTREGIHISLGDQPWREIMDELGQQLVRPGAQSFFRGARVQLDTGARLLGVTELEELIALMAQHQMTLTSVIGEAETQDAFIKLRSALPAPPEILPAPPAEAEPPATDATALLIHRTIRSGQLIRHAGTIVVIGDVNPGAEVIAEKDILVWGKLRGVVHAGASGDASAMVGALYLAPTQLRIGSSIARAPDEKRAPVWSAEIARIRDGQIVVEPWNAA